MADKDDSSTTSTAAPPVAAAGDVALDERAQRQAEVAVLQRNLNLHLARLGSAATLPVDGKWDEQTDVAFKQICRVLGIAPERKRRTYQLIAGGSAALTKDERAKRSSDGAAFKEELRRRFMEERERAGGGLGGTPLPRADARRATIAALQQSLNAHHRKLRTGIELAVDGEWDPHTERAFKQVCRVLGLAPLRSPRTYRIIAGAAESRTPEELAKAKADGARFGRRLRANGLPPLVVLGEGSLSKDEREQAFLATLQNALNQHLVRLGSPAILAVDGKWGKHTERAFNQVCLLLGIAPARSMRTYRIISGSLAPLTAAERKLAVEKGLAVEKQLRDEFAHQRATMPPPKPKRTKKPPRDKVEDRRPERDDKKKPVKDRKDRRPVKRPTDARLAAAIERNGGRYAQEIIAASRQTGVPVALLCAIVQKESTFRNVYGRDSGRRPNPVRSPAPPRSLEVTRENYRRYREHVKNGFDLNGVGPCQLTSDSFQRRADQLGGCWKPDVNIRVGAEVILLKIRLQGGSLRNGLRAYNGSGPAAEAYADDMMKRMRDWERRLGTSKAVGGGGGGGGPRTLRVTSPMMRGKDVKRLQRAINRQYAAWGVRKRVGTDGAYGDETKKAAREVAFGLGVARSTFAKGITPDIARVIADPVKRTAAQRERSRKRAGFRKKLNRAPDVSALLRGNPAPKVAGLLEIIVDAHRHGLVVTSTTGGKHAAKSMHYTGNAVDFGVIGNPFAAESQRRFLAFQHKHAKNRQRFAELIGPDVNKNVKNGVFIRYGAQTEAAHKNHVHVGMR